MKKIMTILLGLALGTSLVGTAFASYTYNPYSNGTYCTQDAYVCPNGTTVGRTGSNCQFVCPSTPTYTYPTTNNSYTYTSGCYTYYYNGITRTNTLISNNCSTNYTYTYPTQTYYYTQPTSYVSPYSTYCYQNGSWYPASNYNCNNYYNDFTLGDYLGGYTDTGYGNSNYYYVNYSDSFIYTQPSSCYYLNGYQVCY